jgi:DNA-binding protein HU-beta
MTKQELAEVVADKAGCNTKMATKVLDAAVEVIEKAVKAGGEVTLRGFGTFKKQHMAAKPARNITTGEAITIPAHNVPVFKAGKEFKEAVK